MQNKKENDVKICDDIECIFKKRMHEHVVTNNGGYIRYINETPKENENANPR
jgi:hypothetical protein